MLRLNGNHLNGEIEAYYDDNSNENNDDTDDADLNMPLISVQKKPIRIDRITPKLINLMNEEEKDAYINICRQLYSEVYEV
jgi:hypothetical protein